MGIRNSRLACMLALGLVAVFAVAGCGGGDDSGGSATAGGDASARSDAPATIHVGELPIAAVAPLYLGVEKGIFERENLKVVPETSQGGAAIVPAVMSGQFQFGYASIATLLFAHDRGLPLKIVTAAGVVRPDDPTGVYTLDAAIREPADLRGKTIGVNTLNQVDQVTITALLERAGLDARDVKFIEVPFPTMPSALFAHRVDAVAATDPFIGPIAARGGHAVIHQYAETAPDFAVAAYFTSDKYIQENADVVERFQRAMNASLDYSKAHEDELRATIARFTQIPKPVAMRLTLPDFTTDPHLPTIDLQARLMADQGLIGEAPPAASLMYDGAQ